MSTPANNGRLLLVDDELHILHALRRTLRLQGYHIEINTDPEAALLLLDNEDFDVIISDMRMPQMDGADFLAAAARKRPKSIRLLLTGYADSSAMERAINHGHVTSYIRKPWDDAMLIKQVADGVAAKRSSESHDKLHSELKRVAVKLNTTASALEQELNVTRAQLDKTISSLDSAQEQVRTLLQTTVKVFTQMLMLRLSDDGGWLLNEISQQIEQFSAELQLDRSQQTVLRYAAQLYPLGKLVLPDNLLNRPPCQLSDDERQRYEEYPLHTERILAPLEILHPVAAVIRHLYENVDGSGKPDGLRLEAIPLSSRLLRIVLDYHLLLTRQLCADVNSEESARDYLQQRTGRLYDGKLVRLFFDMLNSQRDLALHESDIRILSARELEAGFEIMRDVYSVDGVLLATRGTIINIPLLEKLEEWESQQLISLQIAVCWPSLLNPAAPFKI